MSSHACVHANLELDSSTFNVAVHKCDMLDYGSSNFLLYKLLTRQILYNHGTSLSGVQWDLTASVVGKSSS